MKTPQEEAELSERFWSRVDVGKRTKCWNYKSVKDKAGYGVLKAFGKFSRSNRVAFFLRFGTWPKNACHKCDNAACCNPDHIYDGTHISNMEDLSVSIAQAKKAVPNGSKVGWKEVRKIRKMGLAGESQRSIASRFGITQSAVSLIVNHKSFGLVRGQALRATGKVDLCKYL